MHHRNDSGSGSGICTYTTLRLPELPKHSAGLLGCSSKVLHSLGSTSMLSESAFGLKRDPERDRSEVLAGVSRCMERGSPGDVSGGQDG